jgi:hypothetical protein
MYDIWEQPFSSCSRKILSCTKQAHFKMLCKIKTQLRLLIKYRIMKQIYLSDLSNICNIGTSPKLQHMNPVRIRVRTKNRFSTRKRRLNGAVLRMRPEKLRSLVTAGVARSRSLPAQRPWAPIIGLNFAALHRQWWRLHISEKFLSGT